MYLKDKSVPYFIHNSSGQPEIVMIFPITRDVSASPEKWRQVLDFLAKSQIQTLLVIDKTDDNSAKDYFFNHFQFKDKQLLVFPRSLGDTLFDTLGEIVLDKNMWVIQLHDDDDWSGTVKLPANPDLQTVYHGDFFLRSESKGLIKFLDFSMPNRIVFSLVPTALWNQFTSLIQAQNYHVPGSFDFTFTHMARLACKFEYRPGFSYEWKDDNWSSRKKSKNQLIGLAERDGWECWASPEIANFNRSVDSLVALSFLGDSLDANSWKSEIVCSLRTFQPSNRKRIMYLSWTALLASQSLFKKPIFAILNKKIENGSRDEQLELHRFIIKTWKIHTISELIQVISELASMNKFGELRNRFVFWRSALNRIQNGASGGH